MRRFIFFALILLIIGSLRFQQIAVAQSTNASSENELRVIEVLPADGSVDVRADSTITIIFNRPVIPLTTSLDSDSLPHPLVISPSVEGQGEWLNTSIYVFRPEGYLLPGTEYTIQIDDTLQAVDGSELQSDFTSTFRTISPQLTRLGIGNENGIGGYRNANGDVLLNPYIWLYFNQPVDRAAIERAFYLRPITDTEVSLEGQFKWWDDSMIVNFTPDEPLTIATEYLAGLDLTMSTGVLSVPLGDAPEIRFSTVPLPSILSTSPADGDTDIRAGGFSVSFASPMDASSIEGRITVEPEPEALQEYYQYDRYSLAFPIQPDTTYTITLPDGMRDIYGNRLDAAQSITFTTASLEPSAQLNTPGILGFFNGYNPDTGLYLTHRNIETVDLSLYTVPVDEFVQRLLDDTAYELEPDDTYLLRSWSAQLNGIHNQFLPEYISLGDSDECPGAGTSRLRSGMSVQVNPAHSPIEGFTQPRDGEHSAFLYAGIDLPVVAGPICVEGTYWWELQIAPTTTAWAGETDGEDYLLDPEQDLSSTTIPITNRNRDALAPGIYALQLTYDVTPSSASSEDERQIREQYHTMMVMTAHLTVKASLDRVLVWATDVQTGQPIAHAPITIYTRGRGAVAVGVTDEHGVLEVAIPPVYDLTRQWQVALLQTDTHFGIGSSRWANGIDPGTFGYTANFAPQQYRVYLYTDRPIYRPGQQVHWRGIVRSVDDATYFPPQMDSVPVQILNSRGDILFSAEVPVSSYGTLSGTFTLAEDAMLGSYDIRVMIPTANDRPSEGGATQFSVAEYRQPEFEVIMTPLPEQVVQGEQVQINTENRYFFGAPVTNGNVQYRVIAMPYYFQYRGEGTYQFYDFSDLRDNRDYQRVLHEDSGEIDSQGQYLIEFPAELVDTDRSQIYTIEATTSDLTRQTVSSRTQVIVHAGLVYVGGQPERYIGRAGEPMNVNLIVVDWDSVGVADQPIMVEVIEQRWSSVQERDSSGRTTWVWEMEEIPVTDGRVLTDEEGKAEFTFVPPNGGRFQIRLSTRDSVGNEVKSAVYTWAASADYTPWRQENNFRIDLIADCDQYEVGDTAEILITSPFQGTAEALITVERGDLFTYERITLESNTYIYRLPITAEHIPNVFVSVMIVKGVDEHNPVASFRMGSIQLPVDITERELKVEITADETSAQPGETVTFTLRTTDSQGVPVAAEVGVALTDRASLSVLQRENPTLLSYFYSLQGLGVRTGTPLTMNTDYVSQNIMDMIKGGGGGGGFGISDMRDDFIDTPYWNGHVETNEHGEAVISVTLPDNLTTWRLDARALTLGEDGNMLVGQNTYDLLSTRPLIVRPVTPRFFVVDDVVTLAAVTNNNTGEPLTVDVEILEEGVTVEGPTSYRVVIPAGASRRVEWTATVDEVESVDLVFRAEDVQGNYRDAARPLVGQESDRHIPVYRYVVPETVGTSGVLRDEGTRTEAIALPANIDPTRGELTLRLQSSLAAVTLDGLDYLRNYPHQCIEQTVSRFFPNMMTYRALSDLGIEDPELEAELNAAVIYAVQQLYNWQKADGGWGWFPNDESNPLTTAYALIALAEARRLGFVVQEDVLFRAQQFLRGTFITPRLTTETWQLNRQAFVLYALARSGDADIARTSNLYEFRQRLNLDARAFLMMTLHFIDAEDARIAVLRSNLLAEAVMSATGTHWQESYLDYWNWSTNTRTTAIILGALVQTGAESELLPNVVRWLITQREHRAWKTTQATAWSVMALTDWMVATGELYPNYHYSVSINGDRIARETASPETTRDTLELVQNVGDMLIGELNQLEFERSGGDGALYYTAHLEAYLPVPEVEPLNRGIVVERRYVRPTQAGDEPDNTPITQAQAGEIIEVHLTIIAPNNLYYVVVEDPLPAGVEAIDSRLSISQRIGTRPMANRLDSLRNGWNWWWFNEIAMHDEKVVLYSPYLPAGTYEYVYFVRAGVPGVYNVIPATAQEFYFPEVYGRSAGSVFTVLGE